MNYIPALASPCLLTKGTAGPRAAGMSHAANTPSWFLPAALPPREAATRSVGTHSISLHGREKDLPSSKSYKARGFDRGTNSMLVFLWFPLKPTKRVPETKDSLTWQMNQPQHKQGVPPFWRSFSLKVSTTKQGQALCLVVPGAATGSWS